MDRTEVELSKFGLRMAGNALSATFHATNLASDPTFRATADGKVDLGAVKEVYPLEKGVELAGIITADVQLSGRMSDIEKSRYEQLGAKGTFVVEGLDLTLENLPPVHIRRAAGDDHAGDDDPRGVRSDGRAERPLGQRPVERLPRLPAA